MNESASYRIRGALGASPTSPLLADKRIGDVEVGPVVLDRVAAPQVEAALRRLGSTRFVLANQTVQTARGAFAEVPFVPGRDLDGLRSAHGEALPASTTCALLREVVRALEQAAALGVHHGALSPAVVRVDPDGRVRVLGARGGSEAGDVAALNELALALSEADDGSLDERFAEQAWPHSLAELAEHLSGPPVDLRALAGSGAPTVHPHSLAGTVITEASSGAVTPPRVQIAAVGALTLTLGLFAGWALWGWGAEPAGSGPIEAGVTCEVEADLDASMTGRYLCERDEGGLRCSER